MISALISIYAAGALMTNDVPSNTPHVMPWNENVFLEASVIPEKNEKNIAPVIDATSAIVVDMKNGLILYEKNIHEELPIASLTKLMTTIIVIEENDQKEVATISYDVAQTEGAKIWLAEGEKITVENLLFAALINSANDAAMALAEYNSETVEKFVEKMNTRSEELGLLSTHFVNPTGLDEEPDTDPAVAAGDPTNDPLPPDETETEILQNTSSAYDMTLLGRYAYGKSFIRRTVNKKELEIASTNEALSHKLKNTNELLDSYLPVLGLKTGTTDTAGQCLIAIIENENGNDILTVVLNSPARYKETKVLADWTFRTYTW